MSKQNTNSDRFKLPTEFVNSGRTSYTDSTNNTINLELKKEYIGLVIGKSGATINQIRSDTGANIQLKKIPDSDNQQAIISGSDSQIQDAQQYIMKVIKRVQNNDKRVQNYDRRDRRGDGGDRFQNFNRSDNRYDNRSDNRSDNRYDNRYDNRSDRRSDNRSYNRSDNRSDHRSSNRSEYRSFNNKSSPRYSNDYRKPRQEYANTKPKPTADMMSLSEFPSLGAPANAPESQNTASQSEDKSISFAQMALKKKEVKSVEVKTEPRMVVLKQLKKKSTINREELIETPPSLVVGDYLYIGNENDAKNHEWIQSCDIKHVINLTCNIPNYFEEYVSYLKIPMIDNHNINFSSYLDQVVEYIEARKDMGQKVFIHCDLGVSRSVAMVVGYIMKTQSREVKMAYQMVREKRSISNINESLLNDLVTL